jgi:hydrogenase nickel incorporation protein HypA/HybF
MEMHEISVCEAIADAVRRKAQGRAPARVRVRIGHLRQVVPDSLVFNWDMVTAGTDLAGCVLDVDYIPAVVTCAACGARTTLDLPVLMCGSCDSADVTLVTGDEFDLASFDVAAA